MVKLPIPKTIPIISDSMDKITLDIYLEDFFVGFIISFIILDFRVSLSSEIKTIVSITISAPFSIDNLPKEPDTKEDGYPHTPSKSISNFTFFVELLQI